MPAAAWDHRERCFQYLDWIRFAYVLMKEYPASVLTILWAFASLELGVYNSLVGFCLGGDSCQQRQASHDLIYSTTPVEVSFPVRLCVCHLLLWTETLEAGGISTGCERKVKNQPKTAPSPFTFTFLFIFLPDLLHRPQTAPLFVWRLMLSLFVLLHPASFISCN